MGNEVTDCIMFNTHLPEDVDEKQCFVCRCGAYLWVKNTNTDPKKALWHTLKCENCGKAFSVLY